MDTMRVTKIEVFLFAVAGFAIGFLLCWALNLGDVIGV